MIEPLAAHHDRRDFSCGEPALDTYLRERAAQDVRRGLARVFVATGETRQSIVGYYSVSAASFARAELPAELAKRLPHYPVPAAVVGRLAVDRRHQGRRLGETLLLDAVRRALRASAAIAVYAVIVDAKNERARAFYQRYGFQSFPATPSRLFLPLDTFVKAGL
jgi:ribosomal protein S18 acetylase RimI-like enzyme